MRSLAYTTVLSVAIWAAPHCRLIAQDDGESIAIPDLKPHFTDQFAKGKPLSYPLFDWSKNTKLGDFGYVKTGEILPAGAGISHPYAVKLLVKQRLSDREALIEARIENYNPLLGMTSSRSNGPMVMRATQRPYTSFNFAFFGFDFENSVDDSEFVYAGGLKCSGIYEYTNTLGATTTVPRIYPISLPDIPHPATLGLGVRTWSDRTGKFSVSASFESYDRGSLKLIKEVDGTPIEVKLSVLSTEDQAWLRNKLRGDREAEKNKSEASRH